MNARIDPLRRPAAATVLAAVLILWGATASTASVFNERVAESAADASKTGLWIPPVGSRLTVSGPYLAPPHPYASGHRGIDVPAGPGLAVRAPVGGTVSFVGKVVDRGVLSVRVDEHTVFSLEPVTSDLKVGDTVRAGEHLGSVASGGHCYEECVHLGVRVDGEYVSPLRYFFGRPVLRPWGETSP